MGSKGPSWSRQHGGGGKRTYIGKYGRVTTHGTPMGRDRLRNIQTVTDYSRTVMATGGGTVTPSGARKRASASADRTLGYDYDRADRLFEHALTSSTAFTDDMYYDVRPKRQRRRLSYSVDREVDMDRTRPRRSGSFSLGRASSHEVLGYDTSTSHMSTPWSYEYQGTKYVVLPPRGSRFRRVRDESDLDIGPRRRRAASVSRIEDHEYHVVGTPRTYRPGAYMDVPVDQYQVRSGVRQPLDLRAYLGPRDISTIPHSTGGKATTYESTHESGRGAYTPEANVAIEKVVEQTRSMQEAMHTLEDFVRRNRNLFPEDTTIYQLIRFFQLNPQELREIGEKPDAVVFGVKIIEKLVVPPGTDVAYLLSRYSKKHEVEVEYSGRGRVRPPGGGEVEYDYGVGVRPLMRSKRAIDLEAAEYDLQHLKQDMRKRVELEYEDRDRAAIARAMEARQVSRPLYPVDPAGIYEQALFRRHDLPEPYAPSYRFTYEREREPPPRWEREPLPRWEPPLLLREREREPPPRLREREREPPPRLPPVAPYRPAPIYIPPEPITPPRKHVRYEPYKPDFEEIPSYITPAYKKSFPGAGLAYDDFYRKSSGSASITSDKDSSRSGSSRRQKRFDSAPTFTAKLRPKRCTVGQTTRFNCSVSGLPMPDCQWFKGNTPISEGGRFKISNKYGLLSLEISNAQPDDAGLYTVKATNLEGEVASSASLEVEDVDTDVQKLETTRKPWFILDAQNTWAEVGGRAVIEAQASGRPAPTFKWQKDNVTIGEEDKRYHLFSDEKGNAKLVIKDVVPGDHGLYFCIAENNVGKAKSAATLRVVEKGQAAEERRRSRSTTPVKKPRSRETTPTTEKRPAKGTKPWFVQAPPAQINVKEGEPLTLRCVVDGDPKPQVTWLKGVRELQYSKRHRVVAEGDGHYLMETKNTLSTDSGQYFVVAENPLGKSTTTVWVNVEPMPEGEREEGELRRLKVEVPEYEYETVTTTEEANIPKGQLALHEEVHRISTKDDKKDTLKSVTTEVISKPADTAAEVVATQVVEAATKEALEEAQLKAKAPEPMEVEEAPAEAKAEPMEVEEPEKAPEPAKKVEEVPKPAEEKPKEKAPEPVEEKKKPVEEKEVPKPAKEPEKAPEPAKKKKVPTATLR